MVFKYNKRSPERGDRTSDFLGAFALKIIALNAVFVNDLINHNKRTENRGGNRKNRKNEF